MEKIPYKCGCDHPINMQMINPVLMQPDKYGVWYWKFTDDTIPFSLPLQDVIEQITIGFSLWANMLGLKVIYKQDKEDANFLVCAGILEHCNCPFPFDGNNGVLAHAFFPNSSLRGHVHFDLDENWSIDSNIHLATVAAHEFGHALGMNHIDHIEHPDQLMNAFYTGPRLRLGEFEKLQMILMYDSIYRNPVYSFIRGYRNFMTSIGINCYT